MADMHDEDENGVEYINETNEQSRKIREKATRTSTKAIKNRKKIGATFAKILTKLPILLPILIIIFIILYIFALYGFLSSMPGMFLGKLKETGRSLWRNVVGFITGDFDYVDSEDVTKLAQYLQNQGYDVQGYGFGDVEYKEGTENSFNTGQTKQIEAVIGVKYRRNYLHSYIAASEETYQLAQYSVWGDLKATGAKIGNAIAKFLKIFGIESPLGEFDTLEESPNAHSTGLLNIRGLNKKNIGVDREGEKLNIYTSTDLGSRFGSIYSYDLSGWTSIYGRPTEMFIALHLATGMPDLTYEIATHEDFNTKVNMNIHNVTINYDTDKQLEVINPRAGEIYVKSKIEAAYYEHVIDRVREVYQELLSKAAQKRAEGKDDEADSLEKQAEELLKLLEELEAHRGIKEDIDKFLFDLYENGFSIGGAAHTAFGYSGASCDMKQVSGYGDSHLNGAYKDQMQELMDIVHYGKKGIKHANLPYIASVSKHWFYEDIEFTVGEGGVYRASHQAIKDIHYDPTGTVLEEFSITIWDALLTDEDGTGIFYQVNEPYVEGPNKNIIKRFHEKYYRYDGTIERAHAIRKAELFDKGKGTGYKYIFNGKPWHLNKDDETAYDDNPIKKEKPSFGTPTDTLSAFNILKQVHTEDSDAIYRMLKELATSEAIEGNIEKEAIEKDLKQVLVWPFYIGEEPKKWNVSKDLNEYGIVIDEVEGETFVMPGDGTLSVEGNKLIIEFDTLKSEGEGGCGTIEILTKKFVEEDFYRINPDIVKGMKMIIEGVDVSGGKSGYVYRGTEIGTASNQVKIFMQHEDKSIVGKETGSNVQTTDDNIEEYMNQTYTTYDEAMVIKALTEANGVAIKGAGAKTSDWFINSLNDDIFRGDRGDYDNRYDNKNESTPVEGPLSDKVGDDMDLVYAIVAAEILSTGDVYESAYAVISCIVNRLGVFTNGQNMTSIVKSPGQWATFSNKSYLNYYPRSKLEASNKSIVIKAVDDCISSGVVSHGFNCFYTATEYYQNKVKAKIKRDNGDIENWDNYCRNIGGNFYYKLRNGKCVAEED